MIRTVEQPTCRCIPCDFNCDAGKWDLDRREMDCFGCDGSGVETQCDACFGPECTACETRVKEPKLDGNRLPFCDECYEEMRRGCNEE